MKKNWLGLLLIGIFVVLLYIFFFRNPLPKNSVTKFTKVKDPLSLSMGKKIVLTNPVLVSTPVPTAEPITHPIIKVHPCDSKFEHLLAYDQQELSDMVRNGRFNFTNYIECAAPEYFDTCQIKSTQDSERDIQVCVSNLIFLRTLYLGRLTRNSKKDRKDLTVPELASQFLSDFLNVDKSVKKDLVTLANEIVRLSPNSLMAIKMAIAAHFQIEGNQASVPQSVHDLINSGLNIDPEDPELNSLSLFLMSEGDLNEYYKGIQSFISAQPDNYKGYLAKAHWAYLSNNIEMTKELIDIARSKADFAENQILDQIEINIHQGKKKAFPIPISFTPEEFLY